MFDRKVLVNVLGTAVICALAGAASAHAQQSGSGSNLPQDGKPQSGQYEPPVGEQPTYGKKFRPTEPHADFYLEVNPLLLVRRGLGLEFEKKVGEKFSLGVDLQYTGLVNSKKDGVTAESYYVGVAPKFRLYPWETMTGFFFGAKLFLGAVNSKLDNGTQDKSDQKIQVTPAVHVGYRFMNFRGFTMAGYIGAGLNVPRAEFPKSDSETAAWTKAREDINDANQLVKPDFGLTLGIGIE